MSTEYRKQLEPIKGISKPVEESLFTDLAFCHPAITKVVSVDSDKGELVLELQDGQIDHEDLDRQVGDVVQEVIKSFRFFKKAKVIWDRESEPYLGARADVDRFAEEHMPRIGPGCWATDPIATGLFTYFQNRFVQLAKQMEAEFWTFPCIEYYDDIALPTGYLALHPQHVTFGYQLPPHFNTIRGFAKQAKEKKLEQEGQLDALEPTGFLVCPLVCHNVYRALKGSRLDNPRIITAEGNCYRYEGFRFSNLLRQWEFRMRELVFVGPEAHVQEGKTKALELCQKLVEELDLKAWVEVATDPFFAAEAASARSLQAMSQAKYELRLRINEDSSISGASFNFHGNHFCEPMDIRDGDDNILNTSCVGFGLERWMAAFVARYSSDTERWPAKIREEVLSVGKE